VVLGVAVPLHEERHLRVLGHVVDADLPPMEVEAVRAPAVPVCGGPAQALLEHGDVRHRDHPRQPTAARLGARLHSTPERCTLGGRMVERADDLEVAPVSERQDEVAGAERRMQPTVDERGAEPRADPLDAAG
jgi:hypothetical protein